VTRDIQKRTKTNANGFKPIAATPEGSIGLPMIPASSGEPGAPALTCWMKLGVTNGMGTKASTREPADAEY
jgi:hypothetical protein